MRADRLWRTCLAGQSEARRRSAVIAASHPSRICRRRLMPCSWPCRARLPSRRPQSSATWVPAALSAIRRALANWARRRPRSRSTSGRGSRRHGARRPQLLRHHQLHRSRGALALRARRHLPRLWRGDRHAERHALLRSHDEPALAALRLHDFGRQSGRAAAGGFSRGACRPGGSPRHRTAHRGSEGCLGVCRGAR